MYLLETRPYAETTDAKPDRGFEETLGLYGKNGLLLWNETGEYSDNKNDNKNINDSSKSRKKDNHQRILH